MAVIVIQLQPFAVTISPVVMPGRQFYWKAVSIKLTRTVTDRINSPVVASKYLNIHAESPRCFIKYITTDLTARYSGATLYILLSIHSQPYQIRLRLIMMHYDSAINTWNLTPIAIPYLTRQTGRIRIHANALQSWTYTERTIAVYTYYYIIEAG